MRKTLIILTVPFFLAAAAQAASPRVAAEYALRAPQAPSLRVAVAHDKAGEALAVFAWPAFEGEPYAAALAVMRGEGPPFELSGVWSAALDGRWKRLAVGEEVEVIDNTVEPPYSRSNGLCREFGMKAAALEAALYYDRFVGNGYVTRGVIYELAEGERKPLPFAGGDFLDWAGDERLIVGREVGGSKVPAVSALALYGYNLKTAKATELAGPDEAIAMLDDKLSAGVRNSPYLSDQWRLVPTSRVAAGTADVDIPVPSRGGSFENGNFQFFWRPEGGEAELLGEGFAVAASDDGTWVVTFDGDSPKPLTAWRLEWR
jgi:hypothetical protein